MFPGYGGSGGGGGSSGSSLTSIGSNPAVMASNPWVGAALVGAGMVSDYMGARKARKIADARWHSAGKMLYGPGTHPSGYNTEALNELMRRGELSKYGMLGEQIKAYKQARNQLEGGYRKAESQLGLVGQSSKLQAQAAHQQAMSQSLQQGIAQGLPTTAALNASRAVASDTARRFAEIDSNLGQMYANLHVGRGTAVSALMERGYGEKAGVLGAIAGHYQGNTPQYQPIGAEGYAGMYQMGTDIGNWYRNR